MPVVGVNFGTLVARLRGMTAVDATEARARINQAHRRMVVEGEWIKSRVTIGATQVGEPTYAIDPDIAQLLSVRVNGYRMEQEGADDLEDLNAHDAYVVGRTRGFFAADFSTAGLGQIRIYPTPTVAGQAITGRAIMLPPDLVNDADYPSLPADFHEDLVDGAMATVLLRDDERLSDAFALEERFRARIKELRGRGKRRIGSGPARIKLAR